jgi:hypothetical protein
MSQPTTAMLKARARAASLEIRKHVEAGRRKPRGDASCFADLRDRQARLHALKAATMGVEAETWQFWDEPQRDIADAVDMAIVPALLCVDCDAKDVKECSAAIGELAKLDAAIR